MAVNTTGHLAESAFLYLGLSLSHAFAICKLVNHATKGVTNKIFELAAKIENVLVPQPALEKGVWKAIRVTLALPTFNTGRHIF